MSATQVSATLLVTGIQLVGEELFGILPFLAVLWLCVQRLHLSRRLGILIAVVVSSLLFGAAHLPTYDWHFAQSLIGIGFARLILTLAYIVTRNLWVSAGAHIINDWTGFVFVLEFGHVPINAVE
nr:MULTISPECIES: CPBP family intramembrane glutamic endopeptidase [unclassified Rhizobium]